MHVGPEIRPVPRSAFRQHEEKGKLPQGSQGHELVCLVICAVLGVFDEPASVGQIGLAFNQRIVQVSVDTVAVLFVRISVSFVCRVFQAAFAVMQQV